MTTRQVVTATLDWFSMLITAIEEQVKKAAWSFITIAELFAIALDDAIKLLASLASALNAHYQEFITAFSLPKPQAFRLLKVILLACALSQ